MVAQSVIVEVDEEEGAQKRCLGCQVQGHWEGDGELVLQPEAAQGANLLRILNENWLIFKMQKLYIDNIITRIKNRNILVTATGVQI